MASPVAWKLTCAPRQTPRHPPPCCATVVQWLSDSTGERDRDQRGALRYTARPASAAPALSSCDHLSAQGARARRRRGTIHSIQDTRIALRQRATHSPTHLHCLETARHSFTRNPGVNQMGTEFKSYSDLLRLYHALSAKCSQLYGRCRQNAVNCMDAVGHGLPTSE